MESYITLVLAVLAVILGLLILVKVNKLITMLHTPIVKRVSDTNLKPSARRPLGPQDMAARNNDHRDNRPDRNDRRDRNNGNRPDRGFNRDRGDRRNDRRDGRRDGRRRDFGSEMASQPSAMPESVASSESAPVAPSFEAPSEGRRPLPPRVQATLPEAPVAAPVSAAPAVEQESSPAAAEFDPSKVRYGRRNVMKKVPLDDAPKTEEQPKA